ncbi:Mg/Co/Ni transporter MgtE (contains CBS domain) [Rhodococcus tukisamuensis]|uniref:Mg/Co/Ni transporter MgtE (Contains CBS domain) n=2 Tax=Rhodococcus tukisamuensis TaxID=168276 RepID=A0A1G7CM01_9NOCA|nr:Mg/Co/Ni transporter MgtE (contains CBS domain) [Rhodococcus tukisamuensis]
MPPENRVYQPAIRRRDTERISLAIMAAVSKVFAARLAGLVVLGPDGESIGRVRDVVITIRVGRQRPRVLGLVVELLTRGRIFIPMLRVTAIAPGSVTVTGNVSLRRFAQKPGEVLVLAQVLDTPVRIDDPELEELAGQDVLVVDLGIELTRTRDWVVSRVAVQRPRGRLSRRAAVHVVEWPHVQGLTQSQLALPGQGVAQLLAQFEGMRPADVANAMRDLPDKRRYELAIALDDERLADVVQELPTDSQTDLLMHLEVERAADVLEAMDPDDAADLLGELPDAEAESLLQLMDPVDSEPVRRLLQHSPDTAGGLMTPEPVILTPATTVAEALARARHPDLTPALASIAFVVRPPISTPTGRYLGCVHLQRLLREPPATLVGGILDTDLTRLDPEDSLTTVTRYFARYNLVCGPVVDDEEHLLGAVAVDDVLDHLLPTDWREEAEDDE